MASTELSSREFKLHFGVTLDVCVYKGVTHKQGETWYDGCDYECMCENAKYGYYRCNKRYVYNSLYT